LRLVGSHAVEKYANYTTVDSICQDVALTSLWKYAILPLMPLRRPDYIEQGVYHVYNRGVARLPIFLHADDYNDFRDILTYLLKGIPSKKDAILPVPKDKPYLPVTYKADPLSNGLFRSSVDLIAYCLMPNHFHLLFQVKKVEVKVEKPAGRIASFQALPELVRRLCITYGHKFNSRYRRTGAVYQGRFRVKPVPNDSNLLQVARYIHLNPVVAGLVKKPEQWPNSDYHDYVLSGRIASFQITNSNLLLSYFRTKRVGYREFVEAPINEIESEILGKYFTDQNEKLEGSHPSM